MSTEPATPAPAAKPKRRRGPSKSTLARLAAVRAEGAKAYAVKSAPWIVGALVGAFLLGVWLF